MNDIREHRRSGVAALVLMILIVLVFWEGSRWSDSIGSELTTLELEQASAGLADKESVTVAVVYVAFPANPGEGADSALVSWWEDFEGQFASHYASMSYGIHQMTLSTVKRTGPDSIYAWVAPHNTNWYDSVYGSSAYKDVNCDILYLILADSTAAAQLANIDAFFFAHYKDTGTVGKATTLFGCSIPDSLPDTGNMCRIGFNCQPPNNWCEDSLTVYLDLCGHEYGHNLGFGHPFTPEFTGCGGKGWNVGWYSNMRYYAKLIQDKGFKPVHPIHALERGGYAILS